MQVTSQGTAKTKRPQLVREATSKRHQPDLKRHESDMTPTTKQRPQNDPKTTSQRHHSDASASSKRHHSKLKATSKRHASEFTGTAKRHHSGITSDLQATSEQRVRNGSVNWKRQNPKNTLPRIQGGTLKTHLGDHPAYFTANTKRPQSDLQVTSQRQHSEITAVSQATSKRLQSNPSDMEASTGNGKTKKILCGIFKGEH